MGLHGGTDIRIQRLQEEIETARSNSRVNEASYKLGVEEVAQDPVIYVDPDRINRGRIGPPGKNIALSRTAPERTLRHQLEGQVEGSSNALLDRFTDGGTEKGTLRQLAKELRTHGPAALSDVNVNNQDFGFAIIPRHNIDTKKDLVTAFTKHGDLEFDRADRRAILENMPGTDAQWMRAIGNHEGAHLNNPEDTDTYLETLIEETRADRVAIALLKERGEDDIALAYKDLRALSSRVDPTHSSAPLLGSNDAVTAMHLETAWDHRENTDDAVEQNFDWDSYTGDAETPTELLDEDPDAYFATANTALSQTVAEIMTEYHEDPTSMDAQKAVIEAQIMTDYMNAFEDAYKRRVLGRDIPERAPTQLITQEQEDAYFAEVELLERIEDEEIELAVAADDKEFSTATLFENYDWESHEGPENAWYDFDLASRLPIEIALLEEVKDQVIADYEADPSYENTERMLKLENVIFDAGTLDANLNPAIDEDGNFVEFEEVQLVSDEARRAYYVERIEREDRAEAIENEIGEVRQDHYFEARANYSEETVFANFDWEAYEGEATTPDELYDENVEAYRNAEIAYLENMKAEALAAYEADPSYENTGKLLEAQHIISDRYDAINIDRDIYIAGPNPHQELSIEPFVPEDVELEYYRERMEREAAPTVEADADTHVEQALETETDQASLEDDKGYIQSPDGSAYTTEVASVSGGEPNVDFQDGISVAGMSMSSFFDQNVNPDPDNVTLVSAVDPQTNPDVTIDPSLYQQQDNTQSMQTLG